MLKTITAYSFFVALHVLNANLSLAETPKPSVGVWLADAIVERHQPTIDALTHHGWDHSNSIVLHGIEKIYAQYRKPTYFRYIKRYADEYIDDEGNISGLLTTLDGMHPGVICLFLYEQTGEEKYRLAAKTMRDHLLGTDAKPSVFAKTPDGLYWHKNNEKYKNVSSVDGLYMKDPFLVRYGVTFGEPETIAAATEQVKLIAARSFNIRSNLAFHAWSYSRDRAWADSITGQSTQHWSRASGWFAMALIDILEFLPQNHADYVAIRYMYQRLAQGLANAQNPSDGLWYQVLDKFSSEGNYPEISGSGMIIYALQKGVDLELLPAKYSEVTRRGWNAIQPYIKTYHDDGPQITSIAPGMSAKINYLDYVSIKPIDVPQAGAKQYSHGYIGVLMASSVME
ncbi:glycoside hydrolase family 88 protein [Gilvimarinus sp. SDUM040013]|uniref:Glycoside hydrolase family 88 protein n=1 Tax=Gilvimarinus gilvus TaxID=3058038 RepID=A0ABU4S1V4_9GAMM|nr:glycoside hydrolase family 88 protein [Gilvimarinus sp. SDUM040013]MDO3385453.1 glycoside hydrolase family 88 protein [Gilvimarinus sp. SDUM040013]MDX6851130.1 glycoside hydrolase family 88 protein [Gilvimarinus sp. SDUM040013]